MTAGRLILLGIAVAGAVLHPRRVPAWAVPLACTVVALIVDTTTPADAGHALRPLAAPLAFLLAAIPLAVLLGRFGYFDSLASYFEGGPRLVAGLWILAAATVAFLNLDAAVVLLTPLYVRIARKVGHSPRFLGFQPVILALLASSFLPVSNLTNLIAASETHATPGEFLIHLGLPGLAACVLGYFCYRGAGRLTGEVRHKEPLAEHPYVATRVIVIGTAILAVTVVGFVVGPNYGVQPWVIALGADAVLVALTRCVPLRAVPVGTAVIAACLGILAASAATGLPLGAALTGTGVAGMVKTAAVTATGANLVNNLPALLIALPFVSGPHGHAVTCSLWPTLIGVNMGPSLLITGSLASLLWVESMKHLGAEVGGKLFFKMGLRVCVPAAVLALGVLLAMAPAVGCG